VLHGRLVQDSDRDLVVVERLDRTAGSTCTSNLVHSHNAWRERRHQHGYVLRQEHGHLFDEAAIEDQRGVQLIGQDLEALINTIANPRSKLCRCGDELAVMHAVTNPIEGWIDDVAGFR